jgi:hypothetical protein
MIYLYIVSGVVMLLTALLFVPVRVYMEYGGKQLQLELWVLKFRFNIKNFMNKPKKQSAKNQSTIEEKQLTFIEKINSIYKKIVYLKKVYTASSKTISKGISTQNITADINFGFSDAAVTGMVTGLVWSLLYEFLGLISIITTVQNHKFNVDAVYDRFVFEAQFSVTLKTRIASVLKILICVLYNLKKYKE